MFGRRSIVIAAVLLTAGGLLLALRNSVDDSSLRQPVPAPAAETVVEGTVAEVTPTEAAQQNDSIEVQLQIHGVESDQGKLRIAVFAGAAGFPDHSQAVQRCSVEPADCDQPLTLVLPNTGEFAIAVYHDIDANRQLNRAAFGYPTEPYGFSRDARSTFGPPDYQAAAVQIEASGNDLALTIR